MADQAEWLRIGHGGVVPMHLTDTASKADAGPGTVEGWAAVYNVIDAQDDIVMPGAFAKTLQLWRSTKRVIPLAVDHDHSSDNVIGSLTNASETPYGMKFAAGYSNSPKAQNTRQLAKEGHVNGLSIFGPIMRKSYEMRDGREIRILHEVGLMEVSMTAYPANPDALVTAVKGGAHRSPVIDRAWNADGHVERVAATTDALVKMFAVLVPGNTDLASKASYALPHHEVGADGQPGPANLTAVRSALAKLSTVAGLDDAAKTVARAHLQGHLDDHARTDALDETWVTDMRSALSISVPAARKAAVDSLVGAHYQLAETAADDGSVDPDTGGGDEGTGDDPARYALSLVDGSPDAATDPIDDLLNSGGQDQTSAELDALEAQLRQS